MIVTERFLANFKASLLKDLADLLAKQNKTGLQKEWLKTAEVCKLLGISQGKLQVMRSNRTITYTQIGGNMYYHIQDIYDVFERNKVTAVQL